MPRRLDTMPLQLTLQTLLWCSSNAALQQARLASPSWNGKWPPFAASFFPDPEMMESAVRQELARRNTKLLKGINAYLTHPYARPELQARTVWRNGSARLLDYGVEGSEKASVFFIPSLINRYYIVDLKPGNSLVAYLRAHGIRPFVVDWGDPGEAEKEFSCAEYVLQRLVPALQAARQESAAPMIGVGYCMGGLLALALAQFAPNTLDGLALLATPWDFHAPGFPRIALDSNRANKLRAMLSQQETVPGGMVQALFYASNPWVFAKKFAKFSTLENESEAEEFVILENWVNDSVDMTGAVARECFIDWVQENSPYMGNWRVEGQIVSPQALTLPCFIACPLHDTVVPPDCAEPLLPLLKKRTICRPASGHVGMVAGPHAELELWQPLAEWIKKVAN